MNSLIEKKSDQFNNLQLLSQPKSQSNKKYTHFKAAKHFCKRGSYIICILRLKLIVFKVV